MFTQGADIIDNVMERIRHEVELCDTIHAFNITNSVCGGFGSGFASLVLGKIREEYPAQLCSSYVIYPSWTKNTNNQNEDIYNTTLSTHHLIENSDNTYVIENNQIKLLYEKNELMKKKINTNSFNEINYQIISTILDITSSMRYNNNELNCDLKKLSINLTPFPRLHFFSLTHGPYVNDDNINWYNWKDSNIINNLFPGQYDSSLPFCSVKVEDGKFISQSCIYRCNDNGIKKDEEYIKNRGKSGGRNNKKKNKNSGINFSTDSVEGLLEKLQNKYADDYVTWIPNNIHLAMVRKSCIYYNKCATMITNSTAIKSVFQRLSATFAKMFKSKSFLSHYKEEGMDEMEFTEADMNVRDLITEWQDKQDFVIDMDYNDDDEDYDKHYDSYSDY